jgi:hypothetical protein
MQLVVFYIVLTMQFRINLILRRMSGEVARVCSKVWGDSKYTRNFSRDILRKICVGITFSWILNNYVMLHFGILHVYQDVP